MTEEELRALEKQERTNCPACQAKRQHSAEEWEANHPRAGQPVTRKN